MHFWLIFVPHRQQTMLGKAKLLLYYASFDARLLSNVLLCIRVLLRQSLFLLTQLKYQNIQRQVTEIPSSK